MQAVFAAARKGEWEAEPDGTVTVADQVLSAQEYELVLESPEGVVAAALRSNDAVVSIDTNLTPELEAEGLARDMVREIQNARRAEDLVVTDRIEVFVTTACETALASLKEHRDYLSEQVLATDISAAAAPDSLLVHETKIDSEPFCFSLRTTPSATS